jgi:non-canonical (house-cleaning) NTP pyrophosphatase
MTSHTLIATINSTVPKSQEETQRGAKNRAKAAYEAYGVTNPHYSRPHLAIGVEGGLEWSNTILDDNGSATLWCMAWMAVIGKRSNLLAECLASSDSKFYPVDPQPICGFAKTSTFLLPTAIAKLVQQHGMELGHADDQVFGRVNSKQQSGTVGVLTDGIIDRTEYYQSALVLALVPWIRPDVYVVPPNTKTIEEIHGTPETKGADDPPDESGTTTTSSNLLGLLFGVTKKR